MTELFFENIDITLIICNLETWSIITILKLLIFKMGKRSWNDFFWLFDRLFSLCWLFVFLHILFISKNYFRSIFHSSTTE
jgi:hypothetical protein